MTAKMFSLIRDLLTKPGREGREDDCHMVNWTVTMK